MITHQDVLDHRQTGSWRVLHDRAVAICADAAAKAGQDLRPLLGGGTRLMLALNHRISDDIDLFIANPQWIGYLSPRLNDYVGDIVSSYDEGATALKLRFPEGEIDFVVRAPLIGDATEHDATVKFDLEPCSEVLAKKLFYRGWALTPRDLFDWAAIEAQFPGSVDEAKFGALLGGKGGMKADSLLNALRSLPESAGAVRQWETIKAPAIPDLRTTVSWAMARVAAYSEAFAQQVTHADATSSGHPVPGRGS